MRALIVYAADKRLESLAKGVERGLAQAGFKVDLRAAERSGSTPISVAAYDVVCVGSPVLGFWGGQVAQEVDATLKRCTRLEGKQAAAFVTPKLIGAGKALRRLMGLLERQGAWVQDFAVIGREAEGEAFGRRLEGLMHSRRN